MGRRSAKQERAHLEPNVAAALAAGYLVVHPSGVEQSGKGCRRDDPAPAKRRGIDAASTTSRFVRALVARLREQRRLAARHGLAF